MATTFPHVDTPGDAELISAVRGGDVDAYGQLFERHVEAARRLARQLVSAGEVDDLVSEAFVKVLTVLQRGGGPDVAFRAYLLTAIRRLRVDRLRAGARLQTTDDMAMFDPGVPFRDTAVEGFESEAAARAFASLPERWQLVLWHTEVEGNKPADIAPLLGMSPNSVSALAYRAREGLRQAFLTQHAADTEDDACRWTHQHLGGYIRNGLSRRDTTKVEAHLGECRKCAAIYLELTEVNDNLSALLAPLLLGGMAAAYLSSVHGGASLGGLGLVGSRIGELVGSHATAAVVGGVAATTVVAGATWMAVVPGDRGDDAPVSAEPGVSAAPTPGDDATRTDAHNGQEPGGRDGERSTAGPRVGNATGTIGDPTAGDAPPVADVAPRAAAPSAPDAPGEASQPAPATEPPPDPGGTPDDSGQPDDSVDAQPGGDDPVEGEQPGEVQQAADLSVTLSTPVGTRPQYATLASVRGIPAGSTATLVLTGTGASRISATPGCTGGGTTVTCTLSADGEVLVSIVAPQGATLEADVRGPLPDPLGGNNYDSVAVGQDD